MAHLTLQLGAGVVVPFTAPRRCPQSAHNRWLRALRVEGRNRRLRALCAAAINAGRSWRWPQRYRHRPIRFPVVTGGVG